MRLTILSIYLMLLIMAGCATTSPPSTIEEEPFLERAQTKSDGKVEVTVAIPSAKESEELFGLPLGAKGIQPVWLNIKNKGDEPYWFFPIAVDPNYYSPYEVAYLFGQSGVDKRYTEIKEKNLGHFVPPASEVSGYVFINPHDGTREIVVGLVGHKHLKKIAFFIAAPGIRLDYERVDFEALIPEEEEIVIHDRAHLRAALEQLPCCTTGADGSVNGDPLNIVVVGDVDEVIKAFIGSGWDETEVVSARSMWKAVGAFFSGKTYHHSIVSPLYVFGRPQDFSLQKARRTISARNHIRLWMTSMLYLGKPVWIGQISRDIGIRFTFKTWPPVTHKIAPAVDEAREYLMEDLVVSDSIAELGFVSGVGAAPPVAARENLTGDPYFTDGLRLVFVVANKPVPVDEIHFLKWEYPPQYKDFNKSAKNFPLQW